MKNECSIVKDLLPLYEEKMVSAGTADFVEEHLRGCEACRKEYERVKEPPTPLPSGGKVPLMTLRRKLRIRRLQTVALTAVFVLALAVSALALLGAPIYLPYAEGLVTVGADGKEGLTLTFEEKITDFRYDFYDDPDDAGVAVCYLEIWTMPWDQWRNGGKERLSVTIPAQNKPIRLFYLPNDGGESICLARYDPEAENPLETDGETKGDIVLPRLVLGYYFLIAAAALTLAGAVWLFVRKRPKARIWVERVGLCPAAYLLSHSIVSGIRWATYSASRDLALILFLTLLLYCGFLLAQSLLYLKKEIREDNR